MSSPLERASGRQPAGRRTFRFHIGSLAALLRRRRGEGPLLPSSERLSIALVDAAPDAMLLFDREFVLRFSNARGAALLGCDRPEELVGRRLEEFVNGADLEALRSQMLQTRASPLELSVLRRDGTWAFVEASSTIVVDGEERSQYTLTIWRDVSERTAREGRVQSLSEKLELIARFARLTGSLEGREDLDELVIDSTFVLCPGGLPSLWFAESGGRGLRCVRGAREGSTAEEGSPALDAYRSGEAVFRSGGMSTLAIPIPGDEGRLGVLQLEAADPLVFDAATREALTIFVDQLGLSLENGRLFDEAVERLGQLEALRTIDRAISSTMSISSVLGVIVEEARLRMRVDAADILLFDQKTGNLRFAAKGGFRSEALAHTHLAVGQGYAGRVAAERSILIVPSLAEEPQAFAASPSFAEEGFVAYAGAPLVSKGELQGVLEVYQRSALDANRGWASFFEALAGQAAIAVDNATLLDELQRANVELREAYETTIEGWAEALELRDHQTEGHCRRVALACVELAGRFGIEGKELDDVRHGALLHDIGKMAIPDAILLKAGPLTAEEVAIMRRHTTIGHHLLSSLRFLAGASPIPYSHHERWDGSGYPLGLAGDRIPFGARLFAVVDVWDALRSNRPYRAGWPEDQVLAYIEKAAGSEFDPAVVTQFLAIRRRL